MRSCPACVTHSSTPETPDAPTSFSSKLSVTRLLLTMRTEGAAGSLAAWSTSRLERPAGAFLRDSRSVLSPGTTTIVALTSCASTTASDEPGVGAGGGSLVTVGFSAGAGFCTVVALGFADVLLCRSANWSGGRLQVA